jgi:hypothetical protein
MHTRGWGSLLQVAAADSQAEPVDPDEEDSLRLHRGQLSPDSRHGKVKRAQRDVVAAVAQHVAQEHRVAVVHH